MTIGKQQSVAAKTRKKTESSRQKEHSSFAMDDVASKPVVSKQAFLEQFDRTKTAKLRARNADDNYALWSAVAEKN